MSDLEWRRRGGVGGWRDGSGGSMPDGSYLPTADPLGATLDTTTYDNTITGEGKLTTLVFPQDTAAIAFAIAGDAFPRFLIGTDLNNAGLAFGDGTFDPYNGTAVMFLNGGGGIGFSGYDPTYHPPYSKALYGGDEVAIANNAARALGWDTLAEGDTLLNLFVPATPAILTSGVYCFDIQVVGLGMTPGGYFLVDLSNSADSTDIKASAQATVALPNPVAFLSFTRYLPQNTSLYLTVTNLDGADSRGFKLMQAAVQRIS